MTTSPQSNTVATRVTGGTSAVNIKSGPGRLVRIVVHTSAAGTITIRDALTDTTPVLGVVTCVASVGPLVLDMDIPFTVGLRVTPSSGTLDFSVVYK